MKKISHRTFICLIFCAVILIGVSFFCIKWFAMGDEWATADFNGDIYTNGQLSRGYVLDRDGILLSGVDENGHRTYSDDKTVRLATLHAVGDLQGNINAGAIHAFSTKLAGYNKITGLDDGGLGNNLYLTINSDFNVAAYKALNGRKGTVFVYDYTTGEILCMVSTPTFDPTNIPSNINDENKYEGVYMNRAISGLYTPGSVMKTVTMAAAIENTPGIESAVFNCQKKYAIGEDFVTCASQHGEISGAAALAHSCNSAFAEITLKLGADTLHSYFNKAGLSTSYNINGIKSASGALSQPENDLELAWSGIGQDDDLVNPLSMAVYMGAIANGGKAAEPKIIYSVESQSGVKKYLYTESFTTNLIKKSTAKLLADMMRKAVEEEYGADMFAQLDVCAKSGTAEVADGKADAWFVGFVRDEAYPYAFAVVVENGGSGTAAAGRVASTVIKEMTNN